MAPRFTAFTATLAVLGIATISGGAGTPEQADSFARKIVIIASRAETAGGAGTHRTPVTEAELNSWFEYRAAPVLPEGVTQPKVTIIGNGRLAGEAQVDLEALGKSRSTGGTFDLWRYLGGRVPVTVAGTLHTQDGRGRFEVQQVGLSGVPVPLSLLQELVSYYSRTAENPRGLRLDEPFDLPANIRRIEVGQGQAVVVQ